MPERSKAIKLFIAYADSKEDEALKEQLEKHLYFLKNQGLIQTWDQKKILAGDEIEAHTEKHLHESQIILLLVSVDFFNAKSCEKIKEIALRRHEDANDQAYVIPVMLRRVFWELSSLSKLKVLPSAKYPVKDRYWQDQDEAFTIIVDEVMQVVRLLNRKEENSVTTQQGGHVEIVNPTMEEYKSVVEVKNMQSKVMSNEMGGAHNLDIPNKAKAHQLVDQYLDVTKDAEKVKVANVEISKAELLLKKAMLLHDEALMESDDTTYFDKLEKAHQLCLQARRLEPRNVEVLLELAKILIVLTPDDTSDETEVLEKIEELTRKSTNKDEMFSLAQTRYLLATNNTQSIDMDLLKKAKKIFKKLGFKEWVQDCNEMLKVAAGQNAHQEHIYEQTPPPPPQNFFNPIGQWKVEIHSMIPNTMNLNLHPNGVLNGTQVFIPFNGYWSFQNNFLQLQANMMGNPFHLGIQIQYGQGNRWQGVGTDGYNYVFNKI